MASEIKKPSTVGQGKKNPRRMMLDKKRTEVVKPRQDKDIVKCVINDVLVIDGIIPDMPRFEGDGFSTERAASPRITARQEREENKVTQHSDAAPAGSLVSIDLMGNRLAYGGSLPQSLVEAEIVIEEQDQTKNTIAITDSAPIDLPTITGADDIIPDPASAQTPL